MKTALKILAGLLGVLLAVVGTGAAAIALGGIPHYPTQKVDLHVRSTPEKVARGKRLAGMLCAECHADPVTQKLTGKPILDLPKQFGKTWSRNITQDRERGIGAWTDGEIAYLIRTGIARDGRYTPPWMVKLPSLADDELEAVIAFLRSDDPTVQASPVVQPPAEPSFFTKFLCRVAFKPFAYPTQPITAPKLEDDPIAHGRYLATGALGCFDCHSADFASNDSLHPERSRGFFGGGNAMPDITGKLVYTSNLTPDPETGLGRWSPQEFRRAVKAGFGPGNRVLRAPMPHYPELSDSEADAILAYLKTIPPIKNRPPGHELPQLGPNASAGERVYSKYACYSCHGESGLGSCDLRGAHAKYSQDKELAAWIRDPSKLAPGTKMPTWEGVIEEGEYPSLVEYVRTLGKRASSAEGATGAPKGTPGG